MYFLYSLGGVTFNKCWITLSILNCYSQNFQGFILMKNALNNQVGMLGDMFLWLVANLKHGVIYFIKQGGGNHKIAWVYANTALLLLSMLGYFRLLRPYWQVHQTRNSASKFMLLLFVLPSLTVPWSAACPLANIVLTKMPICPLGESRPPTTEKPSPFFPGPFSNVTVINWVCCCKLLSELLRRFVPSHDPPSDM